MKNLRNTRHRIIVIVGWRADAQGSCHTAEQAVSRCDSNLRGRHPATVTSAGVAVRRFWHFRRFAQSWQFWQ
jgi:hypothetical protein